MLEALRDHIDRYFADHDKHELRWTTGALDAAVPGFSVVRIAPRLPTQPWTYISLGASQIATRDQVGLEFVLQAPTDDTLHVEHLAMVAFQHANELHRMRVGKTIAIGRPWISNATCDHFLVSFPYPFGPSFENVRTAGNHVRILWLAPITKAEADYVLVAGADALEQKLERAKVDMLAADRPSVV